jgi:4-hydroxyacetophenone monooxygenase
MLNRPSTPELPGLRDFAGASFHSAHWDHSLPLAGKRVGVIGTGASSMQLVPAIAPELSHLTIFQRGRHWALPSPLYHRRVSDEENWLFRHVPHYNAWYRFFLMWTVGDRGAAGFRRDPEWEKTHPLSISRENDERRAIMTEHIRRELGGDEDLIAKVLPDYPALGKRILQDNGWYRTLLRPNVELVNEGIERITEKGVRTRDGREHLLDVLVLATGYHPNKFLWPMQITGREGTVLGDLWGEDPRAYLGITMPKFPNLFCIYGPNTNPLVGSVIFMLECQVMYIAKAISAMIERDLRAIECKQNVHDAYNERVDRAHEGLVWRHPKVHSYYNNSKGRVTTNSPWNLLEYWQLTREPDLQDFELRS